MMRAITVVAALLPGLAGAESVTLVGGAGARPAEIVLVGSHGERFTRDPQGVWRQAVGGGVASDLVRARGQGTLVWAVGLRAPPYVHDGKTWNAVPAPNKGAIVLGDGPAVAIAVGKRVYLRSGREW